ncbi:MAG: hypothetical protein JW808_08040 [Victivallales bacterium]|nr:hypothetical protein [Victivallales bacterium]
MTSFSMSGGKGAEVVESPSRIVRIVSGGQTGADRGGLDAAIALDIPHGGWCPKGRLAEDGTIPEMYLLDEMKSKSYLKRTEKNVVESSATVIFSDIPPKGGSLRTAQFAEKHSRPCLCIDMTMPVEDAVWRSVEWLRDLRDPQITLNVAGSRASKAPQLQEWTSDVITQVVCRLNDVQIPGTPEEPATIAIPFFPDIKIACGFLRDAATGFEPETMSIEDPHRNLDPRKHFIARADGDSMDGGNSPIRHGDLLLLEINAGGTISNQIFAVEYRDPTGDTAYLLKRIVKDAPNKYRLKSNNPQYPDIIVQNDSMFPFARLKKVLEHES